MKYLEIIFASLLISCLGLSAYAEDGMFLCLKLKGIDEPKTYFLQEEKPVVTFDGQNVMIKLATAEITTPYTYSQVEKFYFENVVTVNPDSGLLPDAIEDIDDNPTQQKASLAFTYDGHTVQIRGLSDNPKVMVFNLGGVRLQPRISISSTNVVVSVAELPAGVYVIRAADHSFKIIKK